MLTLLFFSFLAGFASILSPCIWPLLPIVLSVSAGEGRRRPLGMCLGVMAGFLFLTLALASLEKILPVPADILRLFAVIVIAFFGLSFLMPVVGEKMDIFFNILRRYLRISPGKKEGFAGGVLVGFSTGLLWAPCAGPILAGIAALAASQEITLRIILVAVVYAAGLGFPLFILATAGFLGFHIKGILSHARLIRPVFGLVMIAAALLLYTNQDKIIQIKILRTFPAYERFLLRTEGRERFDEQIESFRGEAELPVSGKMAPDFQGIAAWLNTTPLNLAQLKGKVVLVDFWTYTCVNCIRTLPFVEGWYEKYKEGPFVVIGVHTPEFAFEKEIKNVQKAVKTFKINYPVALDNDYKTWRVYRNQYWPAEYLIDARGDIRYVRFGEGHEDETERAIRSLLKEAGGQVLPETMAKKSRPIGHYVTPETYLGLARINPLALRQSVRPGRQIFLRPDFLPEDAVAFGGAWEMAAESAQAEKGSVLEIHFRAEQVFLVISPGKSGERIAVFLDDRPVDGLSAGKDVKKGQVKLETQRLYHLIDLKGKPGSHILRLEFQGERTAVYAFSFG